MRETRGVGVCGCREEASDFIVSSIVDKQCVGHSFLIEMRTMYLSYPDSALEMRWTTLVDINNSTSIYIPSIFPTSLPLQNL